MKRIPIASRSNLAQRATELGFAYCEMDGKAYWDESAYYGFSLRQIEDHIEDPTAELAALCLALVARVVVSEQLLEKLRIPEHAWDAIAESWSRGDSSLYGRFDLAYDGERPAKLLEYNADTPTALFEAAIFQWDWLENRIARGQLPECADQFNSIHERLIVRFQELLSINNGVGRLHLAGALDSVEDRGLIAYLNDCAIKAGFTTTILNIEDIGKRESGPFLDQWNTPIRQLFKLYPWEWMLADPFGKSPAIRQTRFIEPIWKAILSNKGILPLLWEMVPGHPNLLPAYFEGDANGAQAGSRFVRKPFYSREGANIEIYDGDNLIDRETGPYGNGGFVRQAMALIPNFDGNYPVLGSWVIGDQACGLGIREDTSPITKNSSRFIPHAILS